MNLFQRFGDTLNSILPLTENEVSIFLPILSTRHIKKHEYFIREGEHCNHVAFINSGLTKTIYSVNNIDYINEFNLPGEFLAMYELSETRIKANFSVLALENTELFLISYDDLLKTYSLNPKFERLGRLIVERNWIYEIRARFFLMKTPEERYIQIMEEKPELFDIVPLKEIAYYIGVTPESLSRIRKRLSSG